MWDKFKKCLGYAWAAPVTFFGLLYAASFWKLGWYKWHGVVGDGLVWVLDIDEAPSWLVGLWRDWAGHAIGNVVVLGGQRYTTDHTLTHELKHVDQVMRLGVFQPIVYGANMLAIKVGCPGSDPYLDNCFEVDARRAAGQVIDVVGQRKKR